MKSLTVYQYVADESGADIRQHFDPMYDFVEKARKEGGRVLVHCGAGASRSATLCAAYLMRVRGWNAKQTLKLVPDVGMMVAESLMFLKRYLCVIFKLINQQANQQALIYIYIYLKEAGSCLKGRAVSCAFENKDI